jgi:hypothetical protein
MTKTQTKTTICKPRTRKPAASAKPATKIGRVVELLRRGEGASLAELVKATGWLPHTARAALTGLKKKGHVLSKAKRDGTTIYAIAKS